MGHVVNDKMLWPDDEEYPNGEGWVYRIVAFRKSKNTQYVHLESTTEEAARAEMDSLLAWSPTSSIRERQWGYQLQRRPASEWEVVEHSAPGLHMACVPKCHIERANGPACSRGACSLREIVEKSLKDGA